MKHDLLLFDLDGTLSDPSEGIWRCFNHSLSHYGYPTLRRDEIDSCIGPPLDESFARLTGERDVSQLHDMVATYRERYSDAGYAENVLYDGVTETLQALSERSVPMAVCTSKRRDFALRILQRFGLDGYFAFVDGGDVGIQKWQQIQALRQEGTVSDKTLMIGDRDVDLEAASRNGLVGGAVLWGFGSREELRGGRPDYWFDAPREWLTLRMSAEALHGC